MSPRIEVLFSEALAQPSAERGAFLAKACGADVELLSQLVALVAAHEGPESLCASHLRQGFGGQVAPTRDLLHEEKPGDAIGHYKLLQKIGEGGCGVVWMAEQEEPVRRRVALKVIKLGMDTKAVVARFEAERQALAMMDHPCIAKVHDAGSTDTGRPFFVMELVRGIPITKYCDENHLTPTARLELFIKVCQAIQHAHQKGVIHRDIKPSNILVTVNDGQPTPKVIDFGIAKATQGKLTDATVFTAFEQFIGTPVYMSPEQAEMSSLDIDTRSDIYSLGVLLYELLTGRPPFDPKVFAQAGVDQIRQQIREVEPARPSRRLGTLDAEERTTIARLRNTAPAQLSLVLRGDLDWVVMRCLEKDRTRRYDTANGLAMDIQRFLRDEPVVARPPSTRYLLHKLMRRNRVAVAGGMAVLVALIAGAIVSAWQAVRATQAEREQSRLREKTVVEYRVGLQRSSRADFKLASRLLEEGNSGEGLALLVRAARSDPENLLVGPRLVSALVNRNFLLPDSVPLKLPSAVRFMSGTADGGAIWVLDEAGTVRVLDGEGRQIVREYSFPTKVVHLALAARNSAVFAVFLDDYSMLVADAATGAARSPSIHPPRMPHRQAMPILSPDGRWIAAGSEDEVWIWDAGSGQLRASLPHPALKTNSDVVAAGIVSCLAFSPDSARLATTAFDNYARVWSVPDGAPLTEPLPGEDRETVNVRFSPDGKLMVVGMFTGAQVRDGFSGALVGPRLPHDGPIDFAFFTPDNRRVVTMSGDRTAKVWAVDSGKLVLGPLTHRGPFPLVLHGGALAWTMTPPTDGQGRLLLTTSADGFTRIWSLEDGALLAEPALQQEHAPQAILARDGSRVVLAGNGGRIFSLRFQRGSARPLVLPRGSGFRSLGLLSAPPARFRRLTSDRLQVFEVASGREVEGALLFPEPAIESQSRRHDPRYLVMRTIRAQQHQLWDTTQGQLRVIPLHGAPGDKTWHQVNQSSDLVWLTGYGSNTIRVWNTHTGLPVSPPLQLVSTVCAFSPSFSPDGKSIAAGDVAGNARVWDILSGRILFDLKPLPNAQVNRVSFSPDGSRIVTTLANGEMRIWDGTNGQPLGGIMRHRIRADHVAFSRDNRTMATASLDGTVRLWDARDGRALGEAMSHRGFVASVQFSPDGSRIATVSSDGAARVWDVNTGLPLTDVVSHDEAIAWDDLAQEANGNFSPDGGRFVCTFSTSQVMLWSSPPTAAVAPEWLLQVATICAGKRLTADGMLADASDELEKIGSIRREIAALPADAPFAEWGRWFFADRATRSIAPGFTITPSEAERLAVALNEKKL